MGRWLPIDLPMFQLGKEKAAEHPAGLLSGKRKAPRERWWCRRGKGHAAALGSAVSEPKPPNAALQGGCQMKFLQNEKPPFRLVFFLADLRL